LFSDVREREILFSSVVQGRFFWASLKKNDHENSKYHPINANFFSRRLKKRRMIVCNSKFAKRDY